ncbi:retron St85 family RNA-directed DNA polymerase [Pectobacterium brasiliense]|uniref:retron St85 family RNA-directed DNA polymerase n=1 Tax=Pectobacterium brasiliense TaxID=180957 RepID=UPI0025A0E768|nr:retron St85 family RNA-directed DNA polymerase [Pectobacterium brasiliense]WJM81071.1 retron St85 family RNA-directed DNA polymerase [Pectobacterium brasiliense]
MVNHSQSLYTQRLLSLPILQSLEDLSVTMRLPVSLISQYVNNNTRYYYNIPLAKKNGGLRSIDSPNRQLKAIQRWILRNILENLSPSGYAKGFVPKLSLLDNALPHGGNQYVLKIDLKDFFPSIKATHVYSVFRAVGYSKNISYYLTSFCTLNGYLPQGSPCSPYLSNLVCLRLDQRVGKYSDKNALIYTRYADDITISGNKLSTIKRAWKVIRMIIEDEGFVINKNKEMLSGPRSKREVTGLITHPVVGLGTKKYNFYRNKIFHLTKKNNCESHEVINGILAFVASVDSKKYEKLKRYYDGLNI